jgi:hypothetical protein
MCDPTPPPCFIPNLTDTFKIWAQIGDQIGDQTICFTPSFMSSFPLLAAGEPTLGACCLPKPACR